jgi:hypothetical protein
MFPIQGWNSSGLKSVRLGSRPCSSRDRQNSKRDRSFLLEGRSRDCIGCFHEKPSCIAGVTSTLTTANPESPSGRRRSVLSRQYKRRQSLAITISSGQAPAELQPVHSDNSTVPGTEMGISMDKRATMADIGTCIFRVSLEPKLYRDIELPGDRTLYDLAEAIVRAYGFGWTTRSASFPS